MSHFRKLGHLDVSAAAAQIDAHPELWDAITWRREGAGCPHRETQDIWLRNLARDEIEANRAGSSSRIFRCSIRLGAS
jgi:hypothetical protein